MSNMVFFPHSSSGFELRTDVFLKEWVNHINKYCPTTPTSPDVVMPRMATLKPIDWYEDEGREFSLEYLCKTLVPETYKNTKHASQVFLDENHTIFERTKVQSHVTGVRVEAVRLTQRALERISQLN
jgi:hypothetical protein